MDRVRVVEEATQPRYDVDSEVNQGEVPDVDQGAESSDTGFEVEEIAPVRRRTYRTYVVLPNCPLGAYDVDGKGTVGDTTLQVRPEGQSSIGPTCPLLASRGKDKATILDSNDSTSENDDMSSKLRGLVDGPLEEPSGACQGLVGEQAQPWGKEPWKGLVGVWIGLTLLWIASRRSLVIVSWRGSVLSVFKSWPWLETDLTRCEEKLKAALDGKQTIREEYIDLSSELIYEFKLCNPNADLSYMGMLLS
uniref:Uncharacterized protein n=1 Tax=Cannabis sativa TaxID=3483 RepID=A0A803P1C0_CANSA